MQSTGERMSQKTRMLDNIKFNNDQPTKLDFYQLYTWTIWQYPRKIKEGLCGAVHPPLPEHGWFPAVIQRKEKKIQVHAHLDKEFETPESAARFLEK
jgi:hypothetical protein